MEKPFRLAVTILLALGATLSPPALEAQDRAAEFIARVEAVQTPTHQGLDALTLQEVMQTFRVPGVSIAVIKDFEIHWAKGYGTADVSTGRPVDDRTLFQAASISKPVTAMAVLKAVQDGRLSLDADVNTVLKSWRVPRNELTGQAPVTLRSLLSHTSGAGDALGFPGYDPSHPLPSAVQILDGQRPSNVGSVFFERPPYTGYEYSGGGFTIIQQLLVDALGKPFPDLLRQTVLDPIGMKDSTFEQPVPAIREAATARAHNGQAKAMDVKWHVYPELAAAGLWTTPSDLARFAIEVQRAVSDRTGRVLSRATAREFITPNGVGPHAVSFSIEKRGEGWYFSHGGSNWGFRCLLSAHVWKGYGLVVMTNGDGGGAVLNEVQSRVAAAYGWDALDKPIPRLGRP